MPADIEPTKPEVPQPPLPDIKSKQKYIAVQKPTQVTPVQANPQQVVRQTGRKAMHGKQKLCQPALTNETVPVPMSRNVAPAKPARVQKQARPAFVKKQKIKTAPKAKIKSATSAGKALPSKASAAAPKQAATVIRKGQVLRDTAIKTAKVAKEAGKKVLRAIAAAAEKAGRSYRRRRRGGSFRCCGDPARGDAVRFAAWNPVRRRGHRHGN